MTTATPPFTATQPKDNECLLIIFGGGLWATWSTTASGGNSVKACLFRNKGDSKNKPFKSI